MTFLPVVRLNVVLDLQGTATPLGTLAWSQGERRAYFEYAPAFLANPLPVSPFHLPARPGVVGAQHRPFDGLHGLFNDSLPDGWGRLLLDRHLRASSIDASLLTPLDRLSAVGQSGMGALAYVPDHPAPDRHDGDLDWFVDQVGRVQADEGEAATADLGALQGAQGGSAGARPKIMIGYHRERDTFVLDYGQTLGPGYERWIVKGRSLADPPEIGAEEQAYALMARAAGIDMAETRLFSTRGGNRLFATRRFDRTTDGRLHMQTASALLNASHREAALGYAELHKLTFLMTRDSAAVRAMFHRMVFNVRTRNRDDHAKNHAFLMDRQGRWTLSPAYDLTFSSGPGGEHSADIAGEGRAPEARHLLTVATAASLSPRDAQAIIDQVGATVDRWPDFAGEAGVSAARTMVLDRVLNGR